MLQHPSVEVPATVVLNVVSQAADARLAKTQSPLQPTASYGNMCLPGVHRIGQAGVQARVLLNIRRPMQ